MMENKEKQDLKEMEKVDEMTNEFIDALIPTCVKLIRKDSRVGFAVIMHSITNVTMNVMRIAIENGTQLPGDLPELFIRTLAAWLELKDEWNKLPFEEFRKKFEEVWYCYYPTQDRELVARLMKYRINK